MFAYIVIYSNHLGATWCFRGDSSLVNGVIYFAVSVVPIQLQNDVYDWNAKLCCATNIHSNRFITTVSNVVVHTQNVNEIATEILLHLSHQTARMTVL